MADGRNFASWQPEAVVNDRIRQQENITTSWQYRQYLTNNASEIMKMNSYGACEELGLPSSFQSNATPSSNVPYTFKSTFDTNAPGFGYNNSNLKQPYLTREQLQSRMIAPVMNFQANK
jgi:hypothetical protein